MKIGKADFVSHKTTNNLVEEGKNCERSSNRKEKMWGNAHIFSFRERVHIVLLQKRPTILTYLTITNLFRASTKSFTGTPTAMTQKVKAVIFVSSVLLWT